MMRWFGNEGRKAASGWQAAIRESGVFYSRTALPGLAASSILESALVQWSDLGHAVEEGEGWLVPWAAIYKLLEDEDVLSAADGLGIPPQADLSPRLVSKGSLTDPTFTVAVAGWSGKGAQPIQGVTLRGAAVTNGGRTELLRRPAWGLLQRITKFAQRPDAERDERTQRMAWGEIRTLAIAAGAQLDDFLYRTIVLTPERLKIGLRRSGNGRDRVIEIVPGFSDCPESWLASFDASTVVRDRYDLPSASGVVQVLVRPEVKTVLEQIRRLPGRRVAGARAEAFITNPFAALGEVAGEVIDPAEFEAERERAGLCCDRFTTYAERGSEGTPLSVGILVESGCGPEAKSFRYEMTFDEAQEFAGQVRASLAAECQLCAWREFEFELLGDVEEEIEKLERAIEEGRHRQAGKASGEVTVDAIYNLSSYSERIQGIGVEKPYASPYIARKDESGGWFPDNLVNIIEFPAGGPTGAPQHVPLTAGQIEELGSLVQEAKAAGQSDVRIPQSPQPLPIQDVERILNAFAQARVDAEQGKLEERIRNQRKPLQRKGLVIKPNVSAVDYLEQRKEILLGQRSTPALPRGLKRNVQLKEHQLEGVAWLQHLFTRSPQHCRGSLLADDMGLGKTLQLLTLIAWAHEQQPGLPPALVVAPVALLENWKEEASKFFECDGLNILEVYGDTLARLRVPQQDIDEQLRRDGLVRFLRPGWRGTANVVLTTYETLRDLEFSFAAEKWSIVVCDEAQKIKNPNALVTRAAKKQNARFRVACTGTPVENTLTDLWCLFDFIQPGLLGALNEFGHAYRRPIEAKTGEQRARVEQLRELTRPQTLRRLKTEVAKDLPRKEEVPDCRDLRLTDYQRALYAHAVSQYSRRTDPDSSTPFKNALGLLQYLRLICTDPRPHGLSGFRVEPLSEYRAKAPKMDWLLRTLKLIRAKGEKALVFCEFKEMQLQIRHYIMEELGYAADIINGDTSASSASEQSRQKRIRLFQERPGFGVIILSPLAVGFGVNIQAANHVIHYTRMWNPAKEDQATDRAFRIGQEKDVYVYCPVVRADDFKTFDEKLDELLAYKKNLAADMLNGAGEVGAADFDMREVTPPEVPAAEARVLAFDDVLSMQPRHFEAYAAVLWARMGFPTVTLTPAAGDNGVDVVAVNGTTGQLIQCKTSHRAGRELGWEAIKDVVTGHAAYRLQYPGIEFKRVCVTTQSFNAGAWRHAELNAVELIDGERLAEIHDSYQITLEDVERVLYTGGALAQ